MKLWLPTVVALSACLFGGADRALAMDLTQALSQAYETNATLNAQRAKLRATDEEVARALSGWRPTATFTGEAGPQVRRANTPSTGTGFVQHRDVRSAEIEVTQPLYTGGRTVAATGEAEQTVSAERARLQSTEQKILLNAATAYVNMVRDQAVLDLNISNEERLSRQLDAIRDRFRVGEVTRTDVSQGEARLAGATADRIQAAGNVEQSRAAFRNAVGIAPDRLAPVPLPADLPATFDEAAKLGVEENPDVITAQFEEAADRYTIESIQGELLPKLDIVGTASRDLETSSESSRLNTLEGLLRLTVPLYSSGSVQARLRAAKQTAAQTRLQADQARSDASANVTQTWEAAQTARARITSYQTQIAAAEVALEGVQRENQVGSRTVLDVLDAEQELVNAKVNLVRAQRDEIVTIFQLKAAIGRLTAAQLQLPVAYYDPRIHYDEVRGKWYGESSSGQ